MKNQTIADLYKRGRLLTIEGPIQLEDGTSDTGSFQVYLQKMNPAENELAARKANAARARVLVAARDHESDEYLNAMNTVLDKSRDDQIADVISEAYIKQRASIESEASEQPEWAENDYLQGLFDAWSGGLSDVWLRSKGDDPDDADPKEVESAQRTFDELTRFRSEVDAEAAKFETSLRRNWDDASDEKIEELSLKAVLQHRAEVAWVEEYRHHEMFLAVREASDHSQRFFESKEAIGELEIPVIVEIVKGLRDLAVDPDEGKESQETPAS